MVLISLDITRQSFDEHLCVIENTPKEVYWNT